MGRLSELFADTVRLSRNVSWLAAHLPAATRIGHYLLRARRQAVAAFPPTDPRHGLIYGPAEHDTCTVGMGSAKVSDDQYMLFYFSARLYAQSVEKPQNKAKHTKPKQTKKQRVAQCAPPSSRNVRRSLCSRGEVWWSLAA